jgi:hypothetical protein
VIARHHTKFHAYFQQPGREVVIEEFNRSKGEYRLIISHHEFKYCMDNAELLLRQQEDLLPNGFWQKIGPKRRPRDGLVRETAYDQDYSLGGAFFEAGSFSQDIGLHQPGNATAPSIEDLVPVVHQSCSLYDSSMSYCKSSVDLIQRCNSNTWKPLESNFVFGTWQVVCHSVGQVRQNCCYRWRICAYFSSRGSSQEMCKDRKCKRASTQQ